MRCPKCSYISFDHLLLCSKCGRDLSSLVEELHGSAMQGEAPEFLGPALAALADAATPATSIEEYGAEFSHEEEIVKHDLGRDNLEKAFSSGPAVDDEAGIDLELAPVYEVMEREEAVELDFEDADEFDIQTEPLARADQQKADLEETPEREEKIADTPGAEKTLTLERSDLSDSPAVTVAEGQKATIDFPLDPPDLWSLNATNVEDDTILDKISVDIFGALAMAGQSVTKSQPTEPALDSETGKVKGEVGRKEIDGDAEIEGVLDKVYTEIVDVLNKDKKYSVG